MLTTQKRLPYEVKPEEIEKRVRKVAKQYNIPEEHSAKIAELIWTLAQMTKEAIPEMTEEEEAAVLEDTAIGGQHGYMKNTSTIKELKTHFQLDESAFDKYAHEITRIAEELEQISPFKEKESHKDIMTRLNGLEREIKELKEILLEIRSKLE